MSLFEKECPRDVLVESWNKQSLGNIFSNKVNKFTSLRAYLSKLHSKSFGLQLQSAPIHPNPFLSGAGKHVKLTRVLVVPFKVTIRCLVSGLTMLRVISILFRKSWVKNPWYDRKRNYKSCKCLCNRLCFRLMVVPVLPALFFRSFA